MTVGKGIMSKADTIAETLKQYREKDGTLPPALQEVERKFNPEAIRSSSCGKSNDRFAPGVCKGRFKVFVFFLFVVVFEYYNVLNISIVLS